MFTKINCLRYFAVILSLCFSFTVAVSELKAADDSAFIENNYQVKNLMPDYQPFSVGIGDKKINNFGFSLFEDVYADTLWKTNSSNILVRTFRIETRLGDAFGSNYQPNIIIKATQAGNPNVVTATRNADLSYTLVLPDTGTFVVTVAGNIWITPNFTITGTTPQNQTIYFFTRTPFYFLQGNLGVPDLNGVTVIMTGINANQTLDPVTCTTEIVSGNTAYSCAPLIDGANGYRITPSKPGWTFRSSDNLPNKDYPIVNSSTIPQNITFGSSFTATQNPTTVPVTITTNPVGLLVAEVGSSSMPSPKTFDWQPGTNHMISIPATQNGTAGTRYVFTGWSDGNTQNPRTITVPSSAVTFRADFKTQYQLTMSANPTNGGSVTPPSGNWYDPGQPVQISAVPNSGFLFNSWTGTGSGSDSSSNTTATVMMNAPISETANFGNCTYALSAAGTNIAASGGSGNFNVITPSSCSYTATTTSSFITITSGANGSGNGTVSFTAAANPGAARTGTISVGGQTFTITQSALVPVTIQTIPAGLSISVDNQSPVSSPMTFDWDVGSPHTISTTSPQSGTPGTRYVFTGWSDGNTQNPRPLNAPTTATTYTAIFKTQHLLTTSVNPAGSGSI